MHPHHQVEAARNNWQRRAFSFPRRASADLGRCWQTVAPRVYLPATYVDNGITRASVKISDEEVRYHGTLRAALQAVLNDIVKAPLAHTYESAFRAARAADQALPRTRPMYRDASGMWHVRREARFTGRYDGVASPGYVHAEYVPVSTSKWRALLQRAKYKLEHRRQPALHKRFGRGGK